MGSAHHVGPGWPLGGRRRLTAALIGVGAMLGAFALGEAVGESSRADYVHPEEYAALQAGAADLEEHLGERHREIAKLRAELDDRDARLAELLRHVIQRRAELATREAELEEREEALAVAEQQTAATMFDNGQVVVGEDVAPGVYLTAGPDGSNPMGCYFAFKTSIAPDAKIVRNRVVEEGRTRVRLEAGDVFESAACEQWIKQN